VTLLRVLRERLIRGSLTERRPDVEEPAPPLFRGMPRIDPTLCRGHAVCAAVCPSDAIEVEPSDAGWRWRLDRARCVGCGACAEQCPTGALAISLDYELAVRRRDDLVSELHFRPDAPTVPGANAPGSPAPAPFGPAAPGLEEAGAELRARVARLFRSSLQIRHLDAGSSNAEDWELNALLNPLYDLQRFGIDFVASPRHADMLVVTGAVTRNLHPALLATYEATPDPKLVVALGADACSGGIVHDSYATAGGVDRCLPVDVYIPGDPPRPQAILHGLLLALDRRAQKVHGQTLAVRPGGRRAG
jgi:Ni,Fe-hydrogenase III small subunit/Pyruvate/2-oxoacid:ferredoxin oxidoreductase delta subunit